MAVGWVEFHVQCYLLFLSLIVNYSNEYVSVIVKSKAEQDHHEWNWTELWKKETFLKQELLDGINAYYLAKPPKKPTKLVIL